MVLQVIELPYQIVIFVRNYLTTRILARSVRLESAPSKTVKLALEIATIVVLI